MNSSLHILLIPDGSRRHARREHLRQLQVTDPGALQQILDRLGEHNAAEALRRLGEDPSSISETSARIDVFDRPEITAPESQLKASYRESAVVLEDMLRLALSDPNVGTLSIYGMQSENLKRPPEMVRSFLNVESDFAERWLEDAEIRSNCSFRLVGNTGLLKQRQNDPEIGTAITRFQRKLEQLESLCLGTRLRVNLLAPYDPEWELSLASRAGVFDATKLAITQGVSLVFRSGSGGRSLVSGALPYQTAYSDHYREYRYFPDCKPVDLEFAIEQIQNRNTDRGR